MGSAGGRVRAIQILSSSLISAFCLTTLLNAEMKKTHRSIFLKEVKEAFPELRATLNDQDGLLHLEMHAFHEFVQDQIEKENRENVSLAFQIIERHFENGNSDLVNAIGVSFLEHLDLGLTKGNQSWEFELLPKSLRQPYDELRKYHGI